MALFATTIFLSAFLLFQVQPMAGKYILPWFGGTPAVWNTCMLFFQTALLAGYGYPLWLTAKLDRKRQGMVHLGLLATAALALLMFPPDASWKPAGNEEPISRILLMLTLAIGIPYVTLSTTGPLLQDWFAARFPGKSPYPLYALSNVGSFLALLSYPFVFEPLFAVDTQIALWKVGFLLFASLAGYIGLRMVLAPPDETKPEISPSPATADAPAAAPVSMSDRLLWIALSGSGSLLLLALTNQLCQDVTVSPLLWVMPLAIYLMTFVFCFREPAWYPRRIWGLFMVGGVLTMAMLLGVLSVSDFRLQLTLYLIVLFIGCMAVHGELARLKPAPVHLTSYYFCMSIGGTLGGACVGLAAPTFFTSGLWEVPLAMTACNGLWYHVNFVRTASPAVPASEPQPSAPASEAQPSRVEEIAASLPVRSSVLILLVFLLIPIVVRTFDVKDSRRNFFGLVQIQEVMVDGPHGRQLPANEMAHGRIVHGRQILEPEFRDQPITYFTESGGIGRLLRNFPRATPDTGLKVGVIGLGIGTLAAYAQPQDEYVFFEIDPNVIDVCQDERYFTYWSRCKAGKKECLLGDARVTLDRKADSFAFDVLAMDAFSGDSVPSHLLTRECLEVYRRHLKADGVLVVNVANRFVDLALLARGLAATLGSEYTAVQCKNANQGIGATTSEFMLITANERILTDPNIIADARQPIDSSEDERIPNTVAERGFAGRQWVRETPVAAGEKVVSVRSFGTDNLLQGLETADGNAWSLGWFGPNGGPVIALEALRARDAAKSLRIGLIGVHPAGIAERLRPTDAVVAVQWSPRLMQIPLDRSPAWSRLLAHGCRLDFGRPEDVLKTREDRFDLLIVEPISSNHLPQPNFSQAALDTYRAVSGDKGVAAFHITHRPGEAARRLREWGKDGSVVLLKTPAPAPIDGRPGWWVLTCRDPAFAELPSIKQATVPWKDLEAAVPTPLPTLPKYPVWTDRYINLYEVLK